MTNTIKTLSLYAAQTERGERPAPESLAAVRADGDLALHLRDAPAIARRLAELGRACPSTSWIVGTNTTSKRMLSRVLGPDAQPAPDALNCGSGVPAGRIRRAEDGLRLTGRWPNVSGCEDADWAGLGLLDDGGAFAMALVPVAELTVDRTWHMAGMRGTGSHTLVADDVPVPAERLASLTMPSGGEKLTYALTVLAPLVGATHGALDAIGATFASDRKPFMSAYQKMSESPGARHWLAEATHLANRADQTMTAVAEAATDETLNGADSARFHMSLADAARDCRAALDLMLDLHGAGGFATSNPLQRFWRDVAVGSRHPHLNPYLAVENYGTVVATS